MHCKVCESAKKSPSIIASHFPKNRDGKTVCPTLLAQQCRGCGMKGHTISYCTNNVPRPVPKKEYKPTPITKSKETKTAYDSLYVSDDEDEENKVIQVVQEEEPIVKKAKKAPKEKGPPKKFCWATADSYSSSSDEEEEEEESN